MLDVLVIVTALASTPASPQAPAGQQATSLLGKPLVPTPPSAEARATLEKNLAAARAEYEKNPDSADAIIWLGRRLAYLGRFRDAIGVYTTFLADGTLFYYRTIVPEAELDAYRDAFQRIGQSIRLTEVR